MQGSFIQSEKADGIEEDEEYGGGTDVFQKECQKGQQEKFMLSVVGKLFLDKLLIHFPAYKNRTNHTTDRKADV